jgi:hypothetical protein
MLQPRYYKSTRPSNKAIRAFPGGFGKVLSTPGAQWRRKCGAMPDKSGNNITETERSHPAANMHCQEKKMTRASPFSYGETHKDGI